MKTFAEWFRVGPRGAGRTTALVKAAKSIGATFVCRALEGLLYALSLIHKSGLNGHYRQKFMV